MVSCADLVFWPWAGGVLASMGGLSGPPPRGPEEASKRTVRLAFPGGVRCSKTVSHVAYPTPPRKAAAGSLAGAAPGFHGPDRLIGDPRQALGFAEHREHVEDAGRSGAAGQGDAQRLGDGAQFRAGTLREGAHRRFRAFRTPGIDHREIARDP